ncbi:MAG: alpha/beta fold hydrolase [bacterium]|nr:alpha/beta fold hydrolase [bacterium]
MKLRNYIPVQIILFIMTLVFAVQAQAGISTEKLYFDITVSPGVTIETGVQIMKKTSHHGRHGHHRHNRHNRHNRKGSTLFMIHGMSHTAETYKPMAERILNGSMKKSVSRIILIDMPGRGESGLPYGSTGVLFGDLSLDDYSQVVIKTLQKLRCYYGIKVDIITAHSMGAIVLQMVQQELINQGTNLRWRFGIKSVLMLAPVLPKEIDWELADSGNAAALISPYVTTSTELGYHIALPAAVWPAFFFTNSNGDVAPGAPSATEIEDLGYSANESLTATLQMVGTPGSGYDRPSISKGIFHKKRGTRLHLVSFSEDQLLFIHPDEHIALYRHLTGSKYSHHCGHKKDKYFYKVTNDAAVHDSYISSPWMLDKIVAKVLWSS